VRAKVEVPGSEFRVLVLVPVLVLVLVLPFLPISAAGAAVGFVAPAPTGPYAVGTTTWRLIDNARPERIFVHAEAH
jgi:hypothetical protein